MTYTFMFQIELEKNIFYEGFTLRVFDNFGNIEGFEKMNWYMQSVDDEAVREAVSIVEEHVIT